MNGTEGWGKPGTDWTFVVFNAKKVLVDCPLTNWNPPTYEKKGKQEPFDMMKVGKCTVTKKYIKQHSSGTDTTFSLSFDVLAMHADGDKGFTTEQSAAVKTQLGLTSLDLVLGDLNLDRAEKVKASVVALNAGDFVIPDEKKKTVYRRIHPYRKIIQAYHNTGMENLGKVDPEFAETEKAMQITQSAHAWNRDAALEYLKTQYENFKNQNEKNKDALPSKWYSTVNPAMFEVGKLTAEVFNMMIKDNDIYEKIRKMKDFKTFPTELGMTKELKMDTMSDSWKDKWLAKMIVDEKREDWIVFNQKRFAEQGLDLLEETILGGDELESIKYTDAPFPIAAWPSDHLPVILKFVKTKQEENTFKTNARQIKRFFLRLRHR